MTTPARQSEADRLELVYYWALTELGNSMAIDAKTLWQESVPDTPEGARRAKRGWAAQLLALLLGYRFLAARLTISYYRLNRALRTDATVRYGDEVAGESTSLEQLRVEFVSVVDEIEAQVTGDESFISGDAEGDFRVEQPNVQFVQDDDDIAIEDVADIDQLIEDAEDAAMEEFEDAIENLGIANFEKKFAAAERKVRVEDSAKDAERAKAYTDASSRHAAATMRIMMNASRGLMYDLTQTDARIKGWVRYSQTGTPCGFCAMLISREVYYGTRDIAQHKGKNQEENKYHDNCKCVTIPIFDIAQYENSELYDQNRYYSGLWQQKIARKFTGDEALSEWRKIIREDNATKTNDATAPEAA